MEKRKLGRSDIELPPLMFGGNVFGWTADEATSFRLLDACIAAGSMRSTRRTSIPCGRAAIRAASPRP